MDYELEQKFAKSQKKVFSPLFEPVKREINSLFLVLF